MRNCIVYIPYKLDKGLERARMIRPQKMINAFKSLSYNVLVISGDKKERRKKNRAVLNDIKNGQKIDFIYMEAYTLPWRLTQENHIPFLLRKELALFDILKKNGVKIGLFYPDIYWKLPNYGKKTNGTSINKWKIEISKMLFQKDLSIYEKYLNFFYVPNRRMADYLMSEKLSKIVEELPPGCEDIDIPQYTYKNIIKLIYAGGIDKSNYNMIECVKAVSASKNIEMELCCREKNWEEVKCIYKKLANNNIHIVHKNAETIGNSYFESDIGLLIFDNIEVRKTMVPFKLYEYISYGLPVIATEGSFAADFILKNHVGWVVKNNKDDIVELLSRLENDREEIKKAHCNCLRIRKENLWIERARKVQNDLSKTGGSDDNKA